MEESKYAKNIAFLLASLFILIVISNHVEALIELKVDSKKVHRPIMEGNSLQYEWKVTNIGEENISGFELIFEVENANTNENVINFTCNLVNLPINSTFDCNSENIHITEKGIYRLFIYPKEKTSVEINEYLVDRKNLIYEDFGVYTIAEIVGFFGVVFTFLILWNQFMKGATIYISHPRFYKLKYDRRNRKLKLALPLLFENDGAKSASVSYLMVILKKGRERIVMKWEKDYDNNSPISQFVVPARNHIEKKILFVADYNGNFQERRYNIDIIVYQSGLDNRETGLIFESKLKLTDIFQDLDYWNEAYQEELRGSRIVSIGFWIMDRLPRGYVRLTLKIYNYFKKLFGKRQ